MGTQRENLFHDSVPASGVDSNCWCSLARGCTLPVSAPPLQAFASASAPRGAGLASGHLNPAQHRPNLITAHSQIRSPPQALGLGPDRASFLRGWGCRHRSKPTPEAEKEGLLTRHGGQWAAGVFAYLFSLRDKSKCQQESHAPLKCGPEKSLMRGDLQRKPPRRGEAAGRTVGRGGRVSDRL